MIPHPKNKWGNLNVLNSKSPYVFKRLFFLFSILSGSILAFGQAENDTTIVEEEIIPDSSFVNELYLNEIDSLWQQSFKEHFCLNTDTAFWNVYDLGDDYELELDTALIYARLELLDAESPIDLSPNEVVLDYIKFYATRRNKQLGRMLGLSSYYFPLFEEKLDMADIPLELKYLPIVESGLNPRARSRVGATGLWQFMYQTGKMYGLNVNSYVDDRMDPVKSSEAAATFLKKLHSMYGDWNLALAAYNAGPGNVNKAIRRSGGKQTYWGVRAFLPRETRGYVPAFIAVNYLMNFHEEYNIYPAEATCSWMETDTLVVADQVRFDQVAHYTGIDNEELAWYNPTFRKGVIPKGKSYALRIPYGAVSAFIANEDSIYAFKKDEEPEIVVENEPTVYYVRSGDVLGTIADKFGVSISQLKAWNNIRGSMIRVGQKLYIYESNRKSSNSVTTKKPAAQTAPAETSQDGTYRYHTVRKGDTLWDIAKLYDGVSVEQIEQLNKGLNAKDLKRGQKIKIQKIGS